MTENYPKFDSEIMRVANSHVTQSETPQEAAREVIACFIFRAVELASQLYLDKEHGKESVNSIVANAFKDFDKPLQN